MSFAKPKDKKSCSKEHYVSPQRGQSGKQQLMQTQGRLLLTNRNLQTPQQISSHRCQTNPNFSPLSKIANNQSSSRDNVQSPRTQRFTYQMSNSHGKQQNQQLISVDRIEKIEETLNKVCYNLDTLLPLLNHVDINNLRNYVGQINVSNSTGNLLHSNNDSLYNICKKLSEHEDKLFKHSKLVHNLTNQLEKQQNNNINNNNNDNIKNNSIINSQTNSDVQKSLQFQGGNLFYGGKENLNQEVAKIVKQLNLEDRITLIEQNAKNELQKWGQLDYPKQESSPLEVQMSDFKMQVQDILKTQEKSQSKHNSQIATLENNIINLQNILSDHHPKQSFDFNEAASLYPIHEQINSLNNQISEFKEFRQFCWKEMDNLWKNIGHLFCEVEMRNKQDLLQKIEAQVVDIPQNTPPNEKMLRVSIIEYFNQISQIERFNNENCERIMSCLKENNSQIDKLIMQQKDIQHGQKDADMYSQDIDTLEDIFINAKFQIEGTKQKMIFEMKRIEHKSDSVESIKNNLVKAEILNKDKIKQDLFLSEHLKKKAQNLMDEVSKNLQQIQEESDNIMNRLTTQLKGGVESFEKTNPRGSLCRSRKGSEDRRSMRKYTFGLHDVIIDQPQDNDSESNYFHLSKNVFS